MGCNRKKILKLSQIEIMKATVAIYDSHLTALDAIEVLKNKCYPVDQLSMIGQARSSNNGLEKKFIDPLISASVSVGMVVDSTLAVLSRVRILPVPDLGFIFGAGAVVGNLASTNLDTANTEVDAILKTIGVNKVETVDFSSQLKEGKFLVVAQGDDDEAEKAKNILCNCAKPIDIVVD